MNGFPNLSSPFILAIITDDFEDGTFGASEVWMVDGVYEVKVGGWYAAAENPLVPLDGWTPAVDDFCLMRSADGEGGTRWEGVSAMPSESGSVSLANGQASLGSDFTITASNLTPQDTGLEITLPSAGTYLVGGVVHGTMTLSVGSTNSSFVGFRVYDETAAAEVPLSTGSASSVNGTSELYDEGSSPVSTIYTVAGAATLRLDGFQFTGSGATLSSAVIRAGSHLNYVKIA